MPSANIANNNKNKSVVDQISANAATMDVAPVEAKHWTSLVGSTDSDSLEPIAGFGAALKRLEDFVLGSIALALLFPLMALISIIVKLDSTGPALYCQARSGRNKAIIKVYKFHPPSSFCFRECTDRKW